MSFLTPWFLLGAAAVGGPILFHLLRRAARERMPFSSLLFLRATPPRVRRLQKIEHWWLLVLRCLGLALLAVAFARPFLFRNAPNTPPPTETRRRLLLLDTSASMRRPGVWDRARAVAEQYLAQASASDQVALSTFDRSVKTQISFKEWSAGPVEQRNTLARQRLEALTPGWRDTELGLALTEAADQFGDEPSDEKSVAQRQVILITDLQEGAKLDGLQGHDWPKDLQVVVERVAASHKSNAGIEILEQTARDSDEGVVRVRAANASDSERDNFRLTWKSDGVPAGATMALFLAPGQLHTLTAPKPPSGMTSGELVLTGGEPSFGTVAYYAVPEEESIGLAYLGADSAENPQGLLYYLRRVFPETRREKVEFVTTNAAGVLASEALRRTAFAVISAPLEAEQIKAVRGWLAGGRTAFMVLTGPAMATTLAGMLDLPEVQITEADGDYALLAEIDFHHPVFAPFDDPRFSDFSHIHFWKHRRWTLPADSGSRVVARFDDGAPALVETPIGQGRLLVLASGWSPADSQLAVSSKFLPLMQQMVEWGSDSSPRRYQFHTGDAIPCPSAGSGPVHWGRPDGAETTLAAGEAFTGTELPGIYTASVGNRVVRFAVNVPLDESRTAARLPDELARLGVPLQSPQETSAAQIEQRELRLRRADWEGQQKLWRWFILGALAAVLAEILLSAALARGVKTAESS